MTAKALSSPVAARSDAATMVESSAPKKRAKAAKSPTQRSLKHLRDLGYLAEVVEKWNPHSKTRHDLYGLIDILAIHREEVLGVQATSGSNVSARVTKITEHENLRRIREAGIGLVVHGWRRNSKGVWTLREEDLS
jgi:hypothetical protein